MHVDVICVGAGVLGTFHAWFAASHGLKVLLLERDSMPAEATVRNFGQCVPSGQEFPEWRDLGIRTLRTWKAIQARADISVRSNGSFYVASDEAELRLLEEMHARDTQFGYPSELLTPGQALGKYPVLRADYVRGALFYPEEISLEPRVAIGRVLDFVREQGGVEYRNLTTVIGCEPKQGLVEVVTSSGERHTADRVIICSGRDFRTLYPGVLADSGMQLCKLQMMLTEPIPGAPLPGNILTGYSIRRYEGFQSLPSYAALCADPKDAEVQLRYGIHALFKQALDGSVIIGDSHEYAAVGATESLDFGTDVRINELILQEASKVMDFPHWRIRSYWNGYYPVHPDGVFDREVEPGIHVVTGIGGKGMSTGAGYAEANIARILRSTAA